MLRNSKGDGVGDVHFGKYGLTYVTERDFRRGQGFSKKTMFNGKSMPNAIAVDVDILKRLSANNIKWLVFRISGLEKYSYLGRISLIDFLVESETICYDKNDWKYKYGEQRLISSERLERVKSW